MYFAKLLVQVQIQFLVLVFGIFKKQIIAGITTMTLHLYIATGGVELLCASIS